MRGRHVPLPRSGPKTNLRLHPSPPRWSGDKRAASSLYVRIQQLFYTSPINPGTSKATPLVFPFSFLPCAIWTAMAFALMGDLFPNTYGGTAELRSPPVLLFRRCLPWLPIFFQRIGGLALIKNCRRPFPLLLSFRQDGQEKILPPPPPHANVVVVTRPYCVTFPSRLLRQNSLSMPPCRKCPFFLDVHPPFRPPFPLYSETTLSNSLNMALS